MDTLVAWLFGLIFGLCLGWVCARAPEAWSEIPADYQHPSEIAPLGCYDNEEEWR